MEFIKVDRSLGELRVRGRIEASEDSRRLLEILQAGPASLDGPEIDVLVHGDHRAALQGDAERRKKKIENLQRGLEKRYVFRVTTPHGARILKLSEPKNVGRKLQGVVASAAREEHGHQLKAQHLGVAASQSLGYLELRQGLRLIRSLQVQEPLSRDLIDLGSLFAQQMEKDSQDAARNLGRSLARMHRIPFFHADLKPFHAFVEPGALAKDLGSYPLRWLDLGRVSFYMTPRKRIINLYQTFRFVLPNEPMLQDALIQAYVSEAGWHERRAESLGKKVRRFLNYKLRTHPHP